MVSRIRYHGEDLALQADGSAVVVGGFKSSAAGFRDGVANREKKDSVSGWTGRRVVGTDSVWKK